MGLGEVLDRRLLDFELFDFEILNESGGMKTLAAKATAAKGLSKFELGLGALDDATVEVEKPKRNLTPPNLRAIGLLDSFLRCQCWFLE